MASDKDTRLIPPLCRQSRSATRGKLITQPTQGRQFGVLGEARVHVLRLNLALDRLARS